MWLVPLLGSPGGGGNPIPYGGPGRPGLRGAAAPSVLGGVDLVDLGVGGFTSSTLFFGAGVDEEELVPL